MKLGFRRTAKSWTTPVGVLAFLLALSLSACSDLPDEPAAPERVAIVTHRTDAVYSQDFEGITRDCEDGEVLETGALYRICVPDIWLGDVVVWAHGYISPEEPLAIHDSEIEGTAISEIVNLLGFAFVTSSYRVNGLAVNEGIQDLQDALAIFEEKHGEPNNVYLVGASEGGIATALSLERHPAIYDGGLATCGPIGDFRRQIDYFGDFRVVFDYFFPGVLPPSPTNIPREVIENWESVYVPRILEAIRSDPDATRQLLSVTDAPFDRDRPETMEETVLGLLWYNVFATNNGVSQLGGQPFDNSTHFYRGSDDDFALNAGAERFSADPDALAEIQQRYQTSGQLSEPVVTMHTTGDPIIPYWHEPLYRFKVFLSGSGSEHLNIGVRRYGHCQFEVLEVLLGFAVLLLKADAEPLTVASTLIEDPARRSEFLATAREYGTQPKIVEPRELRSGGR